MTADPTAYAVGYRSIAALRLFPNRLLKPDVNTGSPRKNSIAFGIPMTYLAKPGPLNTVKPTIFIKFRDLPNVQCIEHTR